jgi:hypothetical protein
MDMRLVTVIAAALLAVPALAAGATAIPTPPLRGAPDPQIADGSLQRSLDAARTRWKAAHVRSYRYALDVSCFCRPNQHVYVVRRGIPKGGAGADKEVATVPRLFRLIQRKIDAGVADLTVTYGKRGVPRSIAVDGSRQIADDEVSYALSRFAVLG